MEILVAGSGTYAGLIPKKTEPDIQKQIQRAIKKERKRMAREIRKLKVLKNKKVDGWWEMYEDPHFKEFIEDLAKVIEGNSG